MKKILSAVLILTMVTVVFVGCTQGATTENVSEEVSQVEDNNGSLDFEEGEQVIIDDEFDDSAEEVSDSEEPQDVDSGDGEADTDDEVVNAGDEEIAQELVGSWAIYSVRNDDLDKKASPTTVFGDGYNFGGTLSFNDDGTFESNLNSNATTEESTGEYSVTDGVITLVCTSGATTQMKLTGYPNSSTLEETSVIDGTNYILYYTK